MSRDFRGSGVICFAHHRVLPAIDLDCQVRTRTGEIDNITADRMLAAKPAGPFQLTKSSP